MNVHRMLELAFRHRAIQLRPQTVTELASHGTNPSAITPIDLIADGCMQYNRCMRYAGMRGRHVLTAFYSKEYREKDDHVIILGSWLYSEMRKPKWFLVDVAREWSGLRAHKSVRQWADHLGVSDKTLYRWRRKGIDRLAEWYAKAIDRVERSIN